MSSIITIENNFASIYEEATKQILKCTPQLYIADKNKKAITPFGSCVLFRHGSNYFLITAGHCLKQENELIQVLVLSSGKFHAIKGALVIQRGLIDLGVIHLSVESTEFIKSNYSFVDASYLLIDSHIKFETEYLIVGYPISKTQVDAKRKKVKVEPFVFIGTSKENEHYSKHGFSIENNVLINYSKRKNGFLFENEMNIGPNPKGISGCGLWYIPSYFIENPEKVNFKLAGIMIEFLSEYNIMAATRTKKIIELVKSLL